MVVTLSHCLKWFMFFHVLYNTYKNSNSVDVPHFDLKEHLYFWMDHSVQVRRFY